MKQNKYLTLLATTLLLAGCGGGSKQPKVSAEKAEEVCEKIYIGAELEENWPEMPDAYSLNYKDEIVEKEKIGKEVVGFRASHISKAYYSKSKQMLYQETVDVEESDEGSFEFKTQAWIVDEGTKLVAYMAITQDGETLYGTETTDEIEFEEFAANQFYSCNVEMTYNFLEGAELFFSEETPNIEAPEGCKTSYKYYYGSKNDQSVEIQEKLVLSAKNVDIDGTKINGEDSVESKLVIEDYLVKSFFMESSGEMKAVDGSNEMEETETESYTYSSKCGSIPTLNKNNWKE